MPRNDPAARGRARVFLAAASAVLSLGLAVLGVLWPLGLTNRVLAGVDALTYFTPYWAYRMAEMRAGHIPLWNPYLFLGSPFLANPQAAVLYPLHWPLSWLSPSSALVWSAILHVWLAAALMYGFARRSLGLRQVPAWLAGAWFGLSGFVLARVENINQLNGLAWLPALLWLFDEAVHASEWRARVRWGSALALVIALQLLAGHTQTSFINLVGLGIYAVWPLVVQLARTWTRRGDPASANPPNFGSHPVSAAALRLWPLLTVVPALLLAAAQLLPTLELNTLGLRTGGLPYRQAVSFSLRPRLLAQSFLPPFGAQLAEAFTSEGYAEFVAYVGMTGLLFAAVGASSLRRSNGTHRPAAQDPDGPAGLSLSGVGARGRSHSALLVLVVAGVLLGLGAYDPLYYLLWRIVPGFDLFRVPARWLALYTLGAAGLAGVGVDVWLGGSLHPAISRPRGRARWLGLLAAGLLVGLLAYQQWPRALVGLAWVAAGLLALGLLVCGRRWPRPAVAGVIGLALVELWLGSRALPYVQATAPAATGLRNAPAALLAATRASDPAGRDRFLSLSDIRYDPGDLGELRTLEQDRLPGAAVERLVRAVKQMEVIAPNLSLLLGLPAVDGYDGGVLPLGSYVKLQSLFLPPSQQSPDGRLREQLHQIPPGRLLDLTGTRYVITDKQNDLWAGDVYYDLEQSASLPAGSTLQLDLSGYPSFEATGLGIVSYLDGAAPPGTAIADVVATDARGNSQGVSLRAGSDTAPGQGAAGQVQVARTWPAWTGAVGNDYLARLSFASALAPSTISVRVRAGAPAGLVLRGLSLVDARTGAHMSITVSPRGDFRRIHSGDVKVYERRGALGRAWLVHNVETVSGDDAALARLADPAFDPRATAVVTGGSAVQLASPEPGDERVTELAYEPDRVLLQVQANAAALLVLADANYPGWEATVDGRPAPILQANLMFRAVRLDAGVHEVEFVYRPASWRLGVFTSLTTLGLLAIAVLLAAAARDRRTA